jgi:histidinol phosphatase-like enzyme
MFKRAVQEQGIVFKNGWYVGYTIADAKAAFKVGSRTALINPTEETIKKLNSFANQKIKKKTRIFKSLTEFEKTLK